MDEMSTGMADTRASMADISPIQIESQNVIQQRTLINQLYIS